MIKIKYRCLIWTAAVVLSSSVQASIILSDNFDSDSDTVGAEPSGSIWTGNNNAGTTTLNVSNDTFFGESNQYLAIIDNDASSGLWIRSAELFSSTLLTLSFDYYQPTVSGQAGDVSLGIGRGAFLSSSDLAHDIEFSAGKIEGQSVGLDGDYHVDIVMNNTGSVVNYKGVSLDHNHMDIWVDGSRIIAGQIAAATGRDVALTGFKFSTINPNVESLYLDNLEVRDETYVVPEPVTAGLLGIGGLVAFFTRRFRRKP
ncbi:PEP-CTERM sorting domain-containing protein [Tichowtungia aerotolerans]|uniref:PEP-CTERM sorting domain-containing protein n=1 Tax=Tichowtungia aerotolerans TaxID=2697043 RepID=A0A6P1M8X8_9BACT|nr:PEP-CTERM sorting domain-containing protein [Tichowtungia aerotolerans]QHI68036.1 PEP-CTERM sorting domain-containing protein [Tichowtungia aerotolerans]